MESRFTFDDIQSSAPQPTEISVAVAKLTAAIVRLKAKRELYLVTRRSRVSQVDDRIERLERRLLQLTNRGGSPHRKARS